MADHHDFDQPFFREWSARRRDQKRSLSRARKLAERLGIAHLDVPVLTVVGSKGKATASIYASATLAAHGFRVGTLTSPPIITNRERIRINGTAIDLAAYEHISACLTEHLD